MLGKEKFNYMNERLDKLIESKDFLIVAHRGQWQGDIIENTINAGKVAHMSGAEIYELDVAQSLDGRFFGFHTGNEKRLTGDESLNLEELNFSEIQNLNIYNSINDITDQKFELIEDIIKKSSKNIIFQLDRSWFYWDEFLSFLDKFDLDIKQRMMIKCPVNKELINYLNEFETDIMLLPIIETVKEFELVNEADNINLIGAEVLAADHNSELYGEKFINTLHEEYNMIAQVNAIKLNATRKLYAGLDDSVSLLEGVDAGWKKLYDLNVDFIQTDWVPQLNYFRKTKKNMSD